jgi:uncharacterized protein YfaS (alpha-2-macroglobulin family)
MVLKCAPSNFAASSLSNGFEVTRTYNAKTEEDGSILVKKGQVIEIKITVRPTADRYNVVLYDKLPGGLEIDNALLKEQTQTKDRTWYDHVRILICYC